MSVCNVVCTSSNWKRGKGESRDKCEIEGGDRGGGCCSGGGFDPERERRGGKGLVGGGQAGEINCVIRCIERACARGRMFVLSCSIV